MSTAFQSFLDRVLEPPSYGYVRDGRFYKPTHREMFREFFSRLNIFKDKRNWAQLVCWGFSAALAIPFYFFVTQYFSWPLAALGFVYSMIILGTHGTIYYHRYSTHRAYQFSHPFWRFLVRNMVVKIIPEEIYVVSHHVHHFKSEEAGDPYNVNGGWWYCFLADVIHQPIRKDLNESEYHRVAKMIDHTGVHLNSYAQYKTWGSICHPAYTLLHFALNWAFWYAVFYAIGGHALATALFGASGFWAFGVRTFNFDGHGGGKDKRRDGIDFNRKDLSINQCWPGLVTGEWHNNHHLYPNGARAGFLPYQFDPAWEFIRFYRAIGAITTFKDYRDDFYLKHYNPYLKSKQLQAEPA